MSAIAITIGNTADVSQRESILCNLSVTESTENSGKDNEKVVGIIGHHGDYCSVFIKVESQDMHVVVKRSLKSTI